MKTDLLRSFLVGAAARMLLISSGCQGVSKPESKGAEDVIDLPEIVIRGTGDVCPECIWGFTLEVERFGEIYEQGYYSEALQEGFVYVKGNERIWGEGDGYIKYDFLIGEMCSVTFEAPVTILLEGELGPEDCNLNFSVFYTNEAGKLYGPCTPEMSVPASDVPVYAEVDAFHTPDPILTDWRTLKASVSRKEPLGNVQWTTNYRALDFYGKNKWDCIADSVRS